MHDADAEAEGQGRAGGDGAEGDEGRAESEELERVGREDEGGPLSSEADMENSDEAMEGGQTERGAGQEEESSEANTENSDEAEEGRRERGAGQEQSQLLADDAGNGDGAAEELGFADGPSGLDLPRKWLEAAPLAVQGSEVPEPPASTRGSSAELEEGKDAQPGADAAHAPAEEDVDLVPGVLVSGMPFPEYNGVYSVDGVQPLANGAPHYVNSASRHVYRSPRGSWMLNTYFTPDTDHNIAVIPHARVRGQRGAFPLGTHAWDVLVAKGERELRTLQLVLLRGEDLAKLSLESTAGAVEAGGRGGARPRKADTADAPAEEQGKALPSQAVDAQGTATKQAASGAEGGGGAEGGSGAKGAEGAEGADRSRTERALSSFGNAKPAEAGSPEVSLAVPSRVQAHCLCCHVIASGAGAAPEAFLARTLQAQPTASQPSAEADEASQKKAKRLQQEAEMSEQEEANRRQREAESGTQEEAEAPLLQADTVDDPAALEQEARLAAAQEQAAQPVKQPAGVDEAVAKARETERKRRIDAAAAERQARAQAAEHAEKAAAAISAGVEARRKAAELAQGARAAQAAQAATAKAETERAEQAGAVAAAAAAQDAATAKAAQEGAAADQAAQVQAAQAQTAQAAAAATPVGAAQAQGTPTGETRATAAGDAQTADSVGEQETPVPAQKGPDELLRLRREVEKHAKREAEEKAAAEMIRAGGAVGVDSDNKEL